MRARLIGIAVGLLVLSQAVVFAQYAPVAGAEDFTDLYSPVILAEGGPVVLGSGPQADTLNPATSGLVQRTVVDLSYLALTAFGDRATGTGWQGHAVNLGLVSPTRAAVFSTSLHIVTSSLAGMPLGSSGWLHASAAKELYPGWLVGAGLRLGGGIADSFDVGVALDLGLLRNAGTRAGLEDFSWGVSLQNLGKWYDPFAASSAMPTPFTPAAGISFTAFRNNWLKVETAGSLSAPGFQNVRGGLATRFSFFNTVMLHAGWEIDLRQVIDAGIDRRSLIPSFGISGAFRTGLGEEGFAAERGWTETEVNVQTAAAPLYNGVWAIGGGINAPLGIIDTEGPVVELDYTDGQVISPNNDGTQDALTTGLSITDERFVMSWWFEVADSDGNLVRSIRNKDERPENEGFQSVVDRLLDVRSGIPIPESIRWDGSTDEGEVAADGSYTFSVHAEDDNGNVGSSSVRTVVLDSTAPELNMAIPEEGERIFSPNGDGNKDLFTVAQRGSSETLWTGEIANAMGVVVRTFEWTTSEPRAMVWDGTSNSGELLPDGVYRYRISCTDEGGNSSRGEVSNIIMNTETTPVEVAIDTSYFSPNGDGVLDVVELTPVVPQTAGIADWELTVREESGTVVARFRDVQVAPPVLAFDGRSDAGTVISEGRYYAELVVQYVNGNVPVARSPEFEVDVTPPSVAVQSDRTLFSPNGDGNLDTVTFYQETSREERWIGSMQTVAGALVRQVTWPTLADQQATWNGRRDDGRLAEDGTYYYTLSSTDLAGNTTVSDPVEVVLDTGGAEIGIRAEFEAFSPNADNLRDRQQLLLRVDRPNDVRSYTVAIVDSEDRTVREFSGLRTVQDSLAWDGTGEDGRRVSDGSYRATMSVEFTNGIRIGAGTADFTVDTAAPSVTVTTPFLLFSPDGDAEREQIRLVQTGSLEEQWTGAIRDANGDAVREYVWAGRVEPFEWDGRDPAGNPVPDGLYSYTVTSTDRAGNSVEVELPGITVDTRVPRLFVTASTTAFSPNGDGIRDSLHIDTYANLLDGATGWRLTIVDDQGLAVREFSGTEVSASERFMWDGRDGRGQIREGSFYAHYSVDYVKGNRPSVETGAFVVDISPPEVAVELSPLPFSPDNDGIDDELAIRLRVDDESAIQAWRLEILDRNSRFFNEFSGRGAPASRILWDGRASDGELVISAEDYPYVLTVSDELGNMTTEEGLIPVDILVIRDGDRLKVQISSITFAPNSPELIIDPNDERGAKNRAILLRLAEIFEKYSSYSIRIEGHAVNVTGTETEERTELQPLSLDRAQSVKDAMVELGISDRRVSVVGLGGTEPIVPHDDLDNRWKNRRVEFVLIR